MIPVGLAAAMAVLAAAGQAPPVEGRSTYAGSGGDVSKYVVLYGEPTYWSLSLLDEEPPPREKALRLRGRLVVFPKPKADPEVSLCVEEGRPCLGLQTPAPEIAAEFFGDAPFRNGHEAQVVGAFTREGFLYWSVDSAPARERDPAAGASRTLEDLVTRPDRFVGRSVTVRGRFRGANLCADFAGDTRPAKEAWVLRDGRFSVWVSGREPRGEGWRLDLRSPGDCVYEVEVEGKVARVGAVLAIEARRLRLVGRRSEEECRRATIGR